MKILFDFELFGDPYIDTHLVDIMLAMKTELKTLLASYEESINTDAGLVLFTLRPDKLTLKYHYNLDSETFNQVQSLLEAFNWNGVVDRFSAWGEN